jgi:hypothetical protein
MTGQPTPVDAGLARLQSAEDALQKVQAHLAAFEELGEQLSLSVHTLEVALGSLGEELRADAARRAEEAAAKPPPESEPTRTARSTDLDGARLVALNMALNGDSREAAGRCLAENYDLPDRERLLDEVFAAIEA